MPDEARDAGEQDGHFVPALRRHGLPLSVRKATWPGSRPMPLVDPVTSATLPFKPMAFRP